MDNLQRFIFDNAPVRGEIAHLKETWQTIMNQRNYPPLVKQLLGEALVSCLLLVGTIKFEGQLSLQFQGDNRLSLILVQCDHQLNMRALANFEENLEEEAYKEAFLQGQMVMNVNQYHQTQVAQSMVPVKSLSMAENLSWYFSQSEQITTHVWLAADDQGAAGMLLQLMPGEGEDSTQKEEFWEYAMHMGQTVTAPELLNLGNEVLLHRLYHESNLRLFESRDVRFKCQCSEEKMRQVLQVLGEEEVNKLLLEYPKIEVNCEFCNQQFLFDSIDTALLFKSAGTSG